MNIKIFNFSILSIFLGLTITFAADLGSTEKQLTLEKAVNIAFKHNPDLENARLEVEKAHARVSEAWGYTMPSIDLSGQYSQAIKKPVFFLPGKMVGQPNLDVVPLEVGSTHSLNMGITAKQLLFNGAVFVGVGASKIYSKAAEELYRGKQSETVTKVRKAFYGVLLAKEAVNMMRTSLKNAEDNLANVKLMRSQGILSEYDELRAEVGVDNIRPLVIQSETNYSLAIISLQNIIGTSLDDSVEITGELNYEPYDEGILKTAEEAMLETNSNLRAVRFQKDVNKAFVNAERSNYLPTIAAFGNYQYQAQKNKLNITSKDMIATSSVGLQLSLNLFEGFQTNAKVEQAKIEVLKSETQEVNVENNLRTALRSITGSLMQAKKRIDAQNRTIETAERGYKIVTTRFLSNAATQLEVNDAQLALTQAKVNRMQAIFDYLVATADLDQLLGRLPSYLNETKE